jgi:hypothetical protein
MIIYYTESSNLFNHSLFEPLVKNRANKSSDFVLLPEKLEDTNVLRCPAHLALLNNCYAVKSAFDYTLIWDGQTFKSPDYNQKFFDDYIYPRDAIKGLVSYTSPKLHFFAEKSVEMELTPAFFHKNDITQKTTVIGGCFDVGQHLREIECAMLLHEPCEIDIKRGDSLYYVKFKTHEKIKFVPFQMVQEMSDLIMGHLSAMRNNKAAPSPLSWWYETTNAFYRKRFLNLIKQNLMV